MDNPAANHFLKKCLINVIQPIWCEREGPKPEPCAGWPLEAAANRVQHVDQEVPGQFMTFSTVPSQCLRLQLPKLWCSVVFLNAAANAGDVGMQQISCFISQRRTGALLCSYGGP